MPLAIYANPRSLYPCMYDFGISNTHPDPLPIAIITEQVAVFVMGVRAANLRGWFSAEGAFFY